MTGTDSGLPRTAATGRAAVPAAGAAGAQQAAAAAGSAEPTAAVLTAFSLKTGMLPSVWNCSQAMPYGSVTQYFSLLA